MADPKALVRRFYDEVFGQGDLDTLDELVADDFVEHEELPGIPPGKEGLGAFIETFRGAFPDLSIEVRAIVAEGDEVWAHVVMRGTHQGEFLGVPASGRPIAVPTVDRVRVVDGRAVEHWGVSDNLQLMQQIGAIPEEG